MISELADKIEAILLQSQQGLSEYELISELQKQQDNELNSLSLQDSFELFQIHFMVFHCLYLISDRWLAKEKYCLQISPIKINLLPYVKSNKEELAQADHLRIYYLDLGNLENTNKEQAEELISSFWAKFSASTDLIEALAILELEDGVSYEQIKQQYRLLAMKYHPDRGGCSTRLADINKAMATLKAYYKNG